MRSEIFYVSVLYDVPLKPHYLEACIITIPLSCQLGVKPQEELVGNSPKSRKSFLHKGRIQMCLGGTLGGILRESRAL